MRSALAFAAAGTVFPLLLAAVTVMVVRVADRGEELRRANRLAQRLANDVVGSALDESDPHRVEVLDQLLGARARDGSIVLMKIWTPEGVVLWSDDHRLIGKQFALARRERALIGTREASAVMTDTIRPEDNVDPDSTGIEVVAGFFDTKGQPLLFEAYLPAGGARIDVLRADLRVLGSVWLLLLLIMLPFAMWLGRRLDRAQTQQRRLLQHSMQASEFERKRLAQDLHDGVIQDLAAVAYVFSALEGQLSGSPESLATAQRASDIVRRDVSALRALSTDLYPPDLRGEGFETALDEMLHHCGQEGLVTELQSPESLDLPTPTALLAYRVIREALRNVVKHAQASRVVVDVARQDGLLLVRVADDGQGFDTAEPPPRGHLGLRVLRDSVTDVGGQLVLRSKAQGGTVLEALLPLASASRNPDLSPR